MFDLNGLGDALSLEASSVYGVSLAPMSTIFQAHGFRPTSGGTLRGISGAVQTFDMVARKGNQTIVVEVLPSADRKMSEVKLINMRAKMWDAAPDLAIVVSPVKTCPELKELARNYHFVMVEAVNEEELEEKLEGLISPL